MEEKGPSEEQIDNQIEYLAEILFEAFMESKGYSSYDWINGEKRWKKEDQGGV